MAQGSMASMSERVQELREARAKVVANARVIIDGAEGRDLTEEEQAQFDSMMGEADGLAEQVDEAERKARLFNAEQGLRASRREVKPVATTPRLSTNQDRDMFPQVVRAWLSHGVQGVQTPAEVYRAADRMGVSLGASTIRIPMGHTRAQTKGTTTAGGYTVPQDFGDKIVEALKYFCPLRDHVTVIHSSNGQALPFPTNDDTGNVAAITAEAAEVTDTDTVFGQKTLGAYNYKSLVRLSMELLQDSAFNLEEYLGRQLGLRIGRAQAVHFENGDGSSKPTGLAYSASSGVASWTTTFANLVSLYHSVDPAYRPGAKWFMADATAAAIRALVDGNGRPLLELNRSLDDGQVESLFGKPVVIANNMDSTGLSKKVIVFGDPTDFIVRDVGEIELIRTNERWVEFGLVGFIAYLRSDSNWFGPARALKAGVTAAS